MLPTPPIPLAPGAIDPAPNKLLATAAISPCPSPIDPPNNWITGNRIGLASAAAASWASSFRNSVSIWAAKARNESVAPVKRLSNSPDQAL